MFPRTAIEERMPSPVRVPPDRPPTYITLHVTKLRGIPTWLVNKLGNLGPCPIAESQNNPDVKWHCVPIRRPLAIPWAKMETISIYKIAQANHNALRRPQKLGGRFTTVRDDALPYIWTEIPRRNLHQSLVGYTGVTV
jgi:hypothetical protein